MTVCFNSLCYPKYVAKTEQMSHIFNHVVGQSSRYFRQGEIIYGLDNVIALTMVPGLIIPR